jgi:hypothetical protein
MKIKIVILLKKNWEIVILSITKNKYIFYRKYLRLVDGTSV